MAGTGNILLKRGITIPTDAALPRGMPATQLIASSPTANTGGLAYVNYPNRLWMGMDGSQAPNADACTGNTQFNWSNVESGSGTAVAVGIGQTISCAGADVTINNTRPLWMGAEIRALTALDDTTGTGSKTILAADWSNPSDFVLVTQKSIHSYVSGLTGGAAVDILVTADNATSVACFIPFVASSTNSQQQALLFDPSNTPLTYIPTTSTLTASTFVGALTGNVTGNASTATTATNATNVTFTPTETSGNYTIPFINNSNGVAGTAGVTANYALGIDTVNSFKYNPSTNILSVPIVTATTFNGALSGNVTGNVTGTASTATNVAATGNAGSGTDFRVLFGTAGGSLPVQYDNRTGEQQLRYDASTSTLHVKNLNVTGSETVTIKSNIETASTFLTLNSDLTTSPTDSAGIILNRGTNIDTRLEWNESTDRWEIVTVAESIPIDNNGIAVSQVAGSSYKFVVSYDETFSAGKRLFENGKEVIITGLTSSSGANGAKYNGTWVLSNPTIGTFDVTDKVFSIKNLDFTVSGAGPTGSYKITCPGTTTDTFLPIVGQSVIISNSGHTSLNGTFKITGTATAGAANPAFDGGNSEVEFYIINNNDTLITTLGNFAGGTSSAVKVPVNVNYVTANITYTNATVATRFAYPIVHTSAPTDSNTAIVNVAYTATGGEPIQTIYNAKLVDVELNNLTMTGSWTMNANINMNENFNISTGGLILPHMNSSVSNFMDTSTPTPNVLTGRTEGQIAYDVSSNRIKYARGVTTSDTTNPEVYSGTSTGTMSAELVDTDSTQTLTNKTLSSTGVIAVTNDTVATNTTSGSIITAGGVGIAGAVHIGTTLNSGGLASLNSLTVAGVTTHTGTTGFTGDITVAGRLNRSGTPLTGITQATIVSATAAAAVGSNFMTLLPATLTSSTPSATATAWHAYSIGAPTFAAASGTGVITDASTLYLAEPLASASMTLTNKFSLIAAGSIKTSASLVFEGSTPNEFDTTLSVVNPTTNNTHTLQNWSGDVVTASGTGSDKYLLNAAASGSAPTWINPDNVVVGGIFFRNEISGAGNSGTVRFPIAFLSPTKTGESSAFGTIDDNAQQTAYIKTDWLTSPPAGTAAGHTTVTNASTGLMYETGNGVGTLYCDYIGATLDCGTY